MLTPNYIARTLHESNEMCLVLHCSAATRPTNSGMFTKTVFLVVVPGRVFEYQDRDPELLENVKYLSGAAFGSTELMPYTLTHSNLVPRTVISLFNSAPVEYDNSSSKIIIKTFNPEEVKHEYRFADRREANLFFNAALVARDIWDYEQNYSLLNLDIPVKESESPSSISSVEGLKNELKSVDEESPVRQKSLKHSRQELYQVSNNSTSLPKDINTQESLYQISPSKETKPPRPPARLFSPTHAKLRYSISKYGPPPMAPPKTPQFQGSNGITQPKGQGVTALRRRLASRLAIPRFSTNKAPTITQNESKKTPRSNIQFNNSNMESKFLSLRINIDDDDTSPVPTPPDTYFEEIKSTKSKKSNYVGKNLNKENAGNLVNNITRKRTSTTSAYVCDNGKESEDSTVLSDIIFRLKAYEVCNSFLFLHFTLGCFC